MCLWESYVIVPPQGQPQVLEELHEALEPAR